MAFKGNLAASKSSIYISAGLHCGDTVDLDAGRIRRETCGRGILNYLNRYVILPRRMFSTCLEQLRALLYAKSRVGTHVTFRST